MTREEIAKLQAGKELEMSEPDKADESEWGLICPFLTDNPVFARGVEFGMLFVEMRTAKRIRQYFTRANQDQILLLASRLNWKIRKMKRWGKDWFWCDMTRPKDVVE